jgi:hypothetical protein
MRRNPVFCLTVILILALGIGANTAIFTLLHGLLLRSLRGNTAALQRSSRQRRRIPRSWHQALSRPADRTLR